MTRLFRKSMIQIASSIHISDLRFPELGDADKGVLSCSRAFIYRRDQMLFDDQGLADCERMFEEDSEASGGLGALRASGEGKLYGSCFQRLLAETKH